MVISDLIFWSLKQIGTRLLESILIVFGIALGVAVITGVVGLVDFQSEQLKEYMKSDQFRTFRLTPVQNRYNPETINMPLERVGEIDQEVGKLSYDDYLFARQELKDYAGCWLARMTGEMLSNTSPPEKTKEMSPAERDKWRKENMFEYGLVTPEVFQLFDFSLIEGSYFTFQDLEEKSKVMVIGRELAKEYFGDDNPVGKTFQLEQGSFTITGVVKLETGGSEDNIMAEYIPSLGRKRDLNRKAFIPYFSYQRHDDLIDQIFVKAGGDVNLDNLYQRLKDYVEQYMPAGISVSGAYLSRKQMESGQMAFGRLIGFFAIAALFIAAINILNLMMARVLRRYRYIGISAAVGASRREIFKQFLAEAILLGIMGSIIGVFLGQGALYLFGRFNETAISFSLSGCLAGTGIAFLMSLVFGLYPAVQAAKIIPADALKIR